MKATVRLAFWPMLLAGLAWSSAALAAPESPAPPLYRPSAQAPSTVAAWLARYTSIAAEQVVSVGDEYIVAVTSSRPAAAARPGVFDLQIRAELTDPDAQAARMLRSLSASLEINCTDHTSHIIEVKTFAGADLTGEVQISRPNEGWVANPKGSYFEDIDTAVCQPGTPRPLVLAASDPASARSAPPAPSRERPAPSLRPAFSTDAPLPRSAAPAPTRTPAAAAPARSGGEAQIAAGASQAKAQAALDGLRTAQPALMKGLSTRIERIERDGVAYYRALVTGFAPPATPAGFCRQLTAVGRACLVR